MATESTNDYWDQVLSVEDTEERGEITCGNFFSYVDPATGTHKKGVFRCGNWRTCEACLNYKIDGEASRLVALEREGHTLWYARVGKGDWQAAAKRLRRRGIKYKRYPGRTSYIVVAVEDLSGYLGGLAYPGEGGEIKSAHEFCDEVLYDFVRGAADKDRVSGWLKSDWQRGEEAKEQAERATGVVVTIEAVGTTATYIQREKAWKQAVAETAGLTPTLGIFTSREKFAVMVKEAVRDRTQAYVRALEAMNAKVTFVRKLRRRVQISQVDWKAYTMKSSDGGVEVPKGNLAVAVLGLA